MSAASSFYLEQAAWQALADRAIRIKAMRARLLAEKAALKL